ncbi:ankyrin repeat domain-containing protein 27 [Planoprotostelium fungivorum]|uniref:Ankyrin repeat domain-containing protein 27 n=1 Tax=Planoprotostelium fungivorum TaxID=1890364 RepID=A0A2P6NB12_9EUKA|nr:ankyrin repeat domain-containing protein 27 [Planoprotostelium fungivorum]
MDTQEDLHYNPFFKILKTRFARIYSQAEKNCSLICVPQASLCTGLEFSLPFIQDHIFSPSPYFAGQFQSATNKSVEIQDNHIVSKSGFDRPTRVKILFEELFYNQEYKPFRVLCIETPLVGPRPVSSITHFPTERSLDICQDFLQSSDENELVLRKIDDLAEEFNTSYVFVKGFIEHARKRVGNIREQSTEYLLCANSDYRKLYKEDSPKLAELEQIIESYLLGKLHTRLFTDYVEVLYKEEDEKTNAIRKRMHSLSQNDLGIRPELQCDLTAAAERLNELDDLTTPLEKLHKCQAVIDCINNTVGEHLANTHSQDSVATDDLIPLLVHVMLQCSLLTLVSNLNYMESFIFCNIANTTLGFTLVTFRAAVQFLDGDHVQRHFLKDEPPVISPRNRVLVSVPSRSSFRASVISPEDSSWRERSMTMSDAPSKKTVEPNRLMKSGPLSTSTTSLTNGGKTKSTARSPPQILSRPPDVIDLDTKEPSIQSLVNKLQRSATWNSS